jgi:hypothetical protein
MSRRGVPVKKSMTTRRMTETVMEGGLMERMDLKEGLIAHTP